MNLGRVKAYLEKNKLDSIGQIARSRLPKIEGENGKNF